MKLLLAAVVLAVVAYNGVIGQAPTTPPPLIPDQCGPKVVPKMKYIPGEGEVVGQATSFGCEMCLDLVLIAETYAECDESKVKDKMEYECDLKYGKGTPADRACRASVDQIAHKVVDDTNANATVICYDILHKECTYTLDAYNPYV